MKNIFFHSARQHANWSGIDLEFFFLRFFQSHVGRPVRSQYHCTRAHLDNSNAMAQLRSSQSPLFHSQVADKTCFIDPKTCKEHIAQVSGLWNGLHYFLIYDGVKHVKSPWRRAAATKAHLNWNSCFLLCWRAHRKPHPEYVDSSNVNLRGASKDSTDDDDDDNDGSPFDPEARIAYLTASRGEIDNSPSPFESE